MQPQQVAKRRDQLPRAQATLAPSMAKHKCWCCVPHRLPCASEGLTRSQSLWQETSFCAQAVGIPPPPNQG